MFSLPDQFPVADRTVDVEDLADYAEWQCLLNRSLSITDIIRPLMLPNDEIEVMGVDDTDELEDEISDKLIARIDLRITATAAHYPFVLEANGQRITAIEDHPSYYPYAYLLLSTRLDMKSQRVWDGIEGDKLLEKFSGEIAENYLGSGAKHIVFGTGGDVAGMRESVKKLVGELKEGRGYRNDGNEKPQDDGVDVVAWKPFADGGSGKLILFGQCKTGMSWEGQAVKKLETRDWCQTWIEGDLDSTAQAKMFFCSKKFPMNRRSWVIRSGIIFDRYRIMNFFTRELPEALRLNMAAWVDAVIAAEGHYPAAHAA